jgi:hypothetical protein
MLWELGLWFLEGQIYEVYQTGLGVITTKIKFKIVRFTEYL